MGERSRDAHLDMRTEALPPPPPKKNSEYRLSRTDCMLRTVLPYFTNILAHSYVTAAPLCFFHYNSWGNLQDSSNKSHFWWLLDASKGASTLLTLVLGTVLVPCIAYLRKCKCDPPHPWACVTRHRERTAVKSAKGQCGSDISGHWTSSLCVSSNTNTSTAW